MNVVNMNIMSEDEMEDNIFEEVFFVEKRVVMFVDDGVVIVLILSSIEFVVDRRISGNIVYNLLLNEGII